MVLPKPSSEDWNWSRITYADAVAQLFPEVADRGIVANDFMPGRSWTPWCKPLKATDLDEAVAKFLDASGRRRALPRERLASEGILCPFYAMRMHTALAVFHARDTHFAFSPERKKDLIEERERWLRRATEARVLARQPIERAIPLGSLHLFSNDLGNLAAEEVQAARQRRFEELSGEAEWDDRMVQIIDAELHRLDCLRGDGHPDTWITPFFVYMANFWVALTGELVPAAGGPLAELLQAAIDVVSGGKAGTQKWGQAKTLRLLFANKPAGEGFRLGEDGWFFGEDQDTVMRRGAAVKELAEIAQHPEKYGFLCSALACGAFTLRDHETSPLALVMREAALRPLLKELEMLPPRLEAQLGWLNTPKPSEMKAALRDAVDAAKRGDPAAAAVVEVAYTCDGSAHLALKALGWSQLYAGFSLSELKLELQARDNPEIEGTLRSGDDRAFEAAMTLIDALAKSKSELQIPDHFANFTYSFSFSNFRFA